MIGSNQNTDARIIREVLTSKFLEDRENFNRTIHSLLRDARDWWESTLLFKLPFNIRRHNHTDWNENVNHDWDTCISCNWNLDDQTTKALLKIQPIEFWKLYLRMPAFKVSINQLDTLSSFHSFLEQFSGEPFPMDPWKEHKKYCERLFKDVDNENIIAKLRQERINLIFIEKANAGHFQINMTNILLYSLLFNLNHLEIARLCVFISYMMLYIEFGLDADQTSSNEQTMRHWNDNGNWGKIINYYVMLAENDIFKNLEIRKCWDNLVTEDGIKIYPFLFKAETESAIQSHKKERLRTKINELRNKSNNYETITY